MLKKYFMYGFILQHWVSTEEIFRVYMCKVANLHFKCVLCL